MFDNNVFIHPTSIVENTEIGNDTKIWAYSHISKNAIIGNNCVIGEGVYIGPNVIIGNNVKIQNHSLIYEGVTIEDNVFIGPNVVTTNDIYPDVSNEWSHRFRKTLFKKGCSIGANSTIVCGTEIGENTLIGAGSVVTKSFGNNLICFGNPCKIVRKK
jgi:UDP-2-acetamido-3-amino-2,3-dideoxy-glucuronate N-acetyltransferase